MGYIYYTKGQYPAFLTLNKLNYVLRELERLGQYPNVSDAEVVFGGKGMDAVNDAISRYLKQYERDHHDQYIEQFYEFACSGEESRDNLYALLDAAACIHKFVGFRQTDTSLDVRFPLGKKYTYIVSKHGTREVLLEIDTDALIGYSGNLHCFSIEFNTHHIDVKDGSMWIRFKTMPDDL